MSGGVLLAHPTGAPFVEHAARALDERGLLARIVTTLDPRTWGAAAPRRRWASVPGVSAEFHPARELARLALSRVPGTTPAFRQRLTDWVYEGIDTRAAIACDGSVGAVYGYEDGCAALFERAREAGIPRVYDLPIAFTDTSTRLQRDEAERRPDLAAGLYGAFESDLKIARKRRELELASVVVVASTFTRNSVIAAGIAPERIKVVPYGVDLERFTPTARDHEAARPFRALFAGRVGPRKGVHHLLEAWRDTAPAGAELHLAGVGEFPGGVLTALPAGVRHHGPLAHDDVARLMRECDLFVFPSLLEGFGLVILEAMACGAPVLTTDRTAGPDIIAEGREGFVVPAGDPAAIASKLEWSLRNRAELAAMGPRARARAEEFSWTRYRQSIGAVVEETMGRS